MPLIWQDSYLSRYADDAETDAASQVDYLFHRFSFASVQGQSVYTLPTYCKSIKRITWLGYKVWPISWREMADMTPSTMVVSESEKYEAPQGRPRFYCLHPNDLHAIRFYPTPNQTLAAVSDPLTTRDKILAGVIISCWRAPDVTGTEFVLPSYISRRTKKCFVLMHAFRKEGKGQNMLASQYYKKKYDFQIELFKQINNQVYVSRRPRLADDFNLSGFGRRPGRPVLPPNFPRGI